MNVAVIAEKAERSLQAVEKLADKALCYSPLIGAIYAIVYSLVIRLWYGYAPPYNGWEFIESSWIGDASILVWVIPYFSLYLSPFWLTVTLYRALPNNRHLFDWHGTIAYIIGCVLYYLIFLSEMKYSWLVVT
jgi:hypothetical protein